MGLASIKSNMPAIRQSYHELVGIDSDESIRGFEVLESIDGKYFACVAQSTFDKRPFAKGVGSQEKGI